MSMTMKRKANKQKQWETIDSVVYKNKYFNWSIQNKKRNKNFNALLMMEKEKPKISIIG